MVLGETIWTAVERNASTLGHKPAYIYEGETYSWAALKHDVEACACSLMGKGVRRKSRVGIWGLNSYEWVVCFFACCQIGACPVLANYSYKRDEMFYFIDYAELEFLLVGDVKDGVDAWAIVDEFRLERGDGLACASMDEIAHSKTGTAEQRALLHSACGQVKPSDTACVIFTSGTTKRPKGVVLTQENVVRMSSALAQRIELTSDDVQVIALAMFHGSGLNACIMPALQVGACSVILHCFSSLKALDAIQRYRCTVFNSVPSLVLLMTRHESFSDYDLSSLRCGIWSGGAVADEQFERISRYLGGMRVVMAYGQTEATSISTMTTLSESGSLRNGLCGTPLEGVQVRIADEKTGVELECGKQGEIQIGGYERMDRYLGMPEQNRNVYTADGWLKTGDYGCLDDAGNLWFAGRIDDMIVRAGENISPAEIESAIASFSNDIGSVKVVGVASKLLGQEIAAFYTASSSINPDELLGYLRTNIAKFKLPTYLVQLDEMPQTSSGKVNAKEIKRLAQELTNKDKACLQAGCK